MKTLNPIELTSAAFSPFGTVIAPPWNVAPAADEAEFAFYPVVSPAELSGTDMFANLICKSRPFELTKLERHVETAEMLCALSGDSLLCVAAPAANPEMLSFDDVRVFTIRQSQAVLMKPGCWHWIPYPLKKEPSLFLLLFKDGTGDNDLEIAVLPEEYNISTT